MLRRLLDLFRGKPVLISGASKLQEGTGKVVDLGDPLAGGRQVVLCRVEGKVYALDAACPHDGGRLIGGPLIDGKYAVCPLHNYHFDPKTGAPVRGVCSKAKTYAVAEANDTVEVRV